MKTKRFDFNFKPLQINVSYSVDGSVPEKQNYDADTDTYTPDYSLTPLIIQPNVSRLDKDEVLAAGSINAELTNVQWREIVGGKRTVIADTNTNYSIITSGGQAGRLTVKKNAAPLVPITLEFTAQYVDARTSQIHTVLGAMQIKCDNSTAYMPVLTLDASNTTVYNPLVDQATQTIHASLRLGDQECPTSKRIFVWEIYGEDNTWHTAGADNELDYFISVAADGASCTIDKSLMGAEAYLRCRAKYDLNGDPSSQALNDASPNAVAAFVRRIPKFEYDYTGVPTNVPAGILSVCPEAIIEDANGVIDNPERELLPLWYIATNKASGSLSYTLVAHGLSPKIQTNLFSQMYGAVIGLDVKDVGPVAAWEDSDGALFIDSDGNILLIH